MRVSEPDPDLGSILVALPTSEAFNKAVSISNNPLLPFSVLLINGSVKEVIGYAVVWRCTDLLGQVRFRQYVAFDYKNHEPNEGVLPGSTRLISSEGIINTLSSQAEDPRGLGFYRAQQQIEVSVDALLFADGTAKGADSKGWLTRWTAWIDAEREIVHLLSPLTNESDLRSNLDDLRSRVTGAPLNSGFALQSRMSQTAQYAYSAFKAPTYDVAYQSARLYFASRVSGLLHSQGAKATLTFLGRLAASKAYPFVHR